MAVELCSRNELKYESGELIKKWSQAELSLLHATRRIDQFYNPTKYHLNISNGYWDTGQKQYIIWIRGGN